MSFHPTSVYIKRAKSDGKIKQGTPTGDRLSVVNTTGSFVDIDDISNDINGFYQGGEKREVASNWCDQIKLFNQAISSARTNNGGIGFYVNSYGRKVSIDYGGSFDPATYSFVDNNCGHWAWLMTQRAGLNAPNFGDSIRNSGWNGGVGMGGILHPVGMITNLIVTGYFGILDLGSQR